jgi:hypothetical protein
MCAPRFVDARLRSTAWLHGWLHRVLGRGPGRARPRCIRIGACWHPERSSIESDEQRFMSLWDLGRIIDQTAVSTQLDSAHLDGSPFMER